MTASDTPAAPGTGSDIDIKQAMQDAARASAHGSRWLMMLRSDAGKSFDRSLVRWTGYSLVTWGFAKGGGHPYTPSLLLHTIGRKSGRIRSSVLPYFHVGAELVVCGSKGGGPLDPLWAENIRADGNCWVHIRRKLVPMRGREVVGDERVQLYPVVAAMHAGLDAYTERAGQYGRDVPLIMLKPRAPLPKGA
jgi:deazaflavin-dependent oxidoreductase (nitroreductase family)